MKFYIIIPVHNEEQFLSQTLNSLVSQTVLPKKIIIVNDASTDETQEIIEEYESAYDFIKGIQFDSPSQHEPGSKVINAFYEGYRLLDNNYDIICKFDGDLIFPSNYLEILAQTFQKHTNIGMAGGFCYIEKNGDWRLENLTGKDHIRGALKAYRKECFNSIGKIKKSIGWDTVDELLARYHGWEVKTIPSLQVKHLKPTGKAYGKSAKYKQGEACYRMRYGLVLTGIASAKLAWNKKNFKFFIDTLHGYFKARKKKKYLVTTEEGKFIRNFRWKNIFGKFNLFSK